jgi:tetratricopeptide (TPR) repeat protein
MPDSQNDLDFGRYRIQHLLGRGGMGEVYLARDTALERDVAIKFVSSQKLQDSAARARLLREAQAAAGLDHPCICPVHEAGVTEDGRAYIVMPFIDGTTLADIIPLGPMPPREALNICSQVADALATAHRHGIVHRDLKPGNIMMTRSGRPRLLDFGIAQTSLVPHVIAEATTVTVGPATSGGLVGTPAYMSPEQVQHRQVDGRSDLFALGVVLYECLTGARAFDGPTPYEAVANVLRLDPPPPSGRVPGLDSRHDALCARLMAKDPNDRFQSAEEVVGAIRVLLPDTGRITGTGTQPILRPPRSITRRAASAVALVVIACAAAFGLWRGSQGTGLPPVPPDADQWYRRGTEALRDGAFHSARLALQHAVEIFPQHALAYARLAEADAELDDDRAAQTHLLRLSSIVADESRLSIDDQLRVRAVRELLLRNVDKSVAALQEFTNRHPTDAGALVDLGRAQATAGLRGDAVASFSRAIEQDHEFAAAYLQLGSVEGAALHLDKALEAFARAERLYEAASNAEGQTEAVLRRAGVLDASNETTRARADAQRALTLASASKNISQQVRARLTLASVTATEGRSSDALQMATGAVADATAAGLDTVAAGGLVDLTATLNDLGRFAEADATIQRAIQIADEHAARRTALRARIQLAELRRLQGRYQEAIDVAAGVLPSVTNGQYRRLELTALLIQARAQLALGHAAEARAISSNVLAVAETLKDDGRIALAESDIAVVDTAFGHYPLALSLRERAAPIFRRQGDQTSLAYSLVNRAELLIRLGRAEDANPLLSELESGIAKKLDAYTMLERRTRFLRLFAAVTALRCQDVAKMSGVVSVDPAAADQSSLVAPAIFAYCDARLNRPPRPVSAAPDDADAGYLAERAYWLAAAATIRGDAATAQAQSMAGLAKLGNPPNDDLRWQLGAVLSVASGAPGATGVALTQAQGVARESLARLEADWKDDFGRYRSRADLVDLRKRAAIDR